MQAIRHSAIADASRYLESVPPPGPPRVDVVHLSWRMGRNQRFDTESPIPLTLPPSVGITSPRWASFHNGCLANRRLRGIPWSAYPVVATPRFKTATEYGARSFTCRDGNVIPTGAKVTIGQALGTASGILVGEPADGGPIPPGDDLWQSLTLAFAALAARDIAPDIEAIGLMRPDGVALWRDTVTALDETRGIAGLVRFHHCHETNAEAILLPALTHATASLDDASLLDIQASYSDLSPAYRETHPAGAMATSLRRGHLKHLARPGTLQVLFRLRRMGKAPHRVSRGVPTLVNAIEGVFARRDAGMLLWEGSGKHPGRWVDELIAWRVSGTLHHFGLARSDGTALKLTDAGERFLDCLHPDAEDPDVLCRWIAPAMANEDIDAKVDAWIMRVFSKCKRRVNLLR